MITIKAYTPEELGISPDNDVVKGRETLKFYSVKDEPFRIYGLYEPKTEPKFHRLPDSVAEATSDGVRWLNYNTAGGRVRFVTTSSYVALHMKNPSGACMNHMPLSGSSSFDLYVNRNGRDTFAGGFRAPFNFTKQYEGVVYIGGGRKEVTINFPLYNGCVELYLGLDSSAELERRDDYRFEKPVVYYGSSITQGGCCSRPGLAYQALISRRLDTNFINLGFSGNAKGEDAICDYMASLDMSVFVCDYDHNAPSVEHLKNTHEKLYKKIRAAHPDMPVIFVGKPDCDPINRDVTARRDVIYSTYNNARLRGEKVIFVDGYSLFAGELREECTVDGCHPNDLGMVRMADAIGKAVDFALAW